MRWIVAILVSIIATGSVLAQALPYHSDPSAREDVPELSQVPAIRFLTTTDFPPFNYRDGSGRLIGFHVDLAQAICDKLDVACTMQAWPWDQAVDALAENQGDALIAGLALDEIAAEQFDFSNLYLMLPGRFVAPSLAADGFDLENLAGLRVAVREGSAHAHFLTTYLGEVEQVGFETEIAALEAVEERKVQLFFGDGMRASFWLNEGRGCCAFVGEPYFSPGFFGEGMAIALPAGHDAVREVINYALVRLKRDGKLDELYLRWFPLSFY